MTAGSRRGLLWLAAFAAAVAAFAVLVALRQGGAPALNRPAPDFALPDLAGQTVTLADLGGGDVVLRFGSVACTVCDPDWTTLGRWQQQAGAALRIAAVEVGQPLAVVRMRLGGQALPVPVLVDAGGAVARAYGVPSLPAFAFIGRGGRLVELQPVLTHGAIWPDATWSWHVRQLLAADARRS
jgi:peroxiredoxin